MKTRRSQAAFTLVEMAVSAAVASLIGLIIYSVATEGVFAFARNISVNRSYSDARHSLDRISMATQSAGHIPVLITATGASITPTTAVPNPYGAGIRFWHYDTTPMYYIATPGLTDRFLKLSLIKPGTTTTIIDAPAAGDMITVAALGFQAIVSTVSISGSTATVNFSDTVANNTKPVLTAIPAFSGATYMAALDWNQTAFVVVNQQMRYYPLIKFVSGSTTQVDLTGSYRIVANVIPTTTTLPYTITPFSLGAAPSVNVDLYVTAPDYNNATNVSSANSYSFLQTALCARNPTLLHTPY